MGWRPHPLLRKYKPYGSKDYHLRIADRLRKQAATVRAKYNLDGDPRWLKQADSLEATADDHERRHKAENLL